MLNEISALKETIDTRAWLEKNWERPEALFIILIFVVYFLFKSFYEIDLEETWAHFSNIEFLVLMAFGLLIPGFWFYSKRLPNFKGENIGIAIAINCETKKERQRLRSEFIDGLKQEISKGNNKNFEILSLSDYQSEQIDSEEKAKEIQKTINAHLFIWGKCRIRKHQGLPTYALELRQSVRHIPVHIKASESLAQEMGRTFPRKVLIPEKNELEGFRITKEMIGLSVKYSFGLACLMSGNPIEALGYHESLWNALKTLPGWDLDSPSPYQYLRKSLPKLLMEETIKANLIYVWERSPNYLEKLKKCLDLQATLEPRNYHAHLSRAGYYFSSGNVPKAKREIMRAKNESDSSWEFSEAFLEAYEGKIEKSDKTYKRAFNGNFQAHVPNQTEEFIRKVLEEEPGKIQLHYCLGMINYFCKEDLRSAKSDFQNFVDAGEAESCFLRSVQVAKEYLLEIEKKLKGRTVA